MLPLELRPQSCPEGEQHMLGGQKGDTLFSPGGDVSAPFPLL